MVWWQGWDDLRWWSSQKQAEIRGRKGTGWVDRNKVGAEELKDEMVELKEPLGRASKTLRGPCRGPRSMQKGVSEMKRFLYPSLARVPDPLTQGRAVTPTVLICGILAQNQSLDQQWGRGRSGPSPCPTASSCQCLSTHCAVHLQGAGNPGWDGFCLCLSQSSPAHPQEPVPSLEKASIVLSCAPP